MLLMAAVPAAVLSAASPAFAQIGSARYSSIVVDAATGRVLESDNPDALRHPASLAKLMTLYLTFEALRDRRITLDTLVPVSAHAASMEPTKLGLVPGSRLTVQQAILGLVTKSANDAAAALGELLGGSEDRFAQMMTLRARALGMNHTTFENASGLPNPNEWTSAHDMAVLARHLLIDFPNYYHYFSTPSFVYAGRVVPNHDTMLKIYPGADGMKTGYTDASGHNLVTSAVRDGVRLIGVVMGAGSNYERDQDMTAQLNEGYEQMDVPIGGRTRVAGRIGLISQAHAATVEPARRLAAARRLALAHKAELARKAELERRETLAARREALVHRVVARERIEPAENWAVQVGSFGTRAAAHAAALAAHRTADNGEVHVVALKTRHHHVIWRAQLVGMSAAEAHRTCHTLARHKKACFMLRAGPRQVASR